MREQNGNTGQGEKRDEYDEWRNADPNAKKAASYAQALRCNYIEGAP